VLTVSNFIDHSLIILDIKRIYGQTDRQTDRQT